MPTAGIETKHPGCGRLYLATKRFSIGDVVDYFRRASLKAELLGSNYEKRPKDVKSGWESVNPRKFLAELRRRNVYKVAIAYLVGGWALSQGIAQVFPVFDVPNWVIRLIVLLIVLSLPVALVLAWAFEADSRRDQKHGGCGRGGTAFKWRRMDLRCVCWGSNLYRLVLSRTLYCFTATRGIGGVSCEIDCRDAVRES